MKKFVLALFFILAAAPLMAQKNAAEARPEIRQLLGDRQAMLYDANSVDSAWFRACRNTIIYAGVLIEKQDSSITTSANKEQYALNSSFVRIRSVWRYNGLNRTPIAILDDPYRFTQAGASMPSDYCFIHNNSLFLFPVPVGTDKIRIFYYGRPTAPTDSSTATDLPTELLQAVVWEGASILVNAYNRPDLSDFYHKRCVELVERYRALISKTGNLEDIKK